MGDATSLLGDTAGTRAGTNVEVAQVVSEGEVERYALCCSGGKDSVLALDRAIRAGLQVDRLLTLYDERSARVRFHGVPVAVMRAQAKALDLPTQLYPTTPATFEQVFVSALADLKAAGIHGLIFGDIHLQDVRAWYEQRVRSAGLAHLEPLWGEPSGRVAREVLVRGYTAILTCVETPKADPLWLGRPLSEDLISACEQRGLDPCGEYGEYHTLVTNSPLFSHPLAVRWGPIHVEEGAPALQRFQQIDVQLAAPA
jgi:diphthine-ammonia ligase